MTVLTDLLLALCNAKWGIALLRQGVSQRQFSQITWGIGFLAAAVAAVLGGTSHAVGDQSPAWRRKLWKGTTLATGFTSAGMFASTVVASTSQPLKGKLLVGTLLKLMAYCGWMASRGKFLYVIVDYGSAMAGVAAFHVPYVFRRGARDSRYLLSGVFISLLAAFVQIRKIKLHRHFNHNDLYHVIQVGACYLFYRGGRLLQDRRDGEVDERGTQTSGEQ